MIVCIGIFLAKNFGIYSGSAFNDFCITISGNTQQLYCITEGWLHQILYSYLHHIETRYWQAVFCTLLGLLRGTWTKDNHKILMSSCCRICQVFVHRNLPVCHKEQYFLNMKIQIPKHLINISWCREDFMTIGQGFFIEILLYDVWNFITLLQHNKSRYGQAVSFSCFLYCMSTISQKFSELQWEDLSQFQCLYTMY